MSDEKDLIQYDEDDAVKFIQNYLPQEIKGKYTNDEINYIIDIVYEYYDEKGFMSDGADEELVDIDEEELVNYVLKNTKKEKINNFSSEEVAFIIQGELAYCDSLGIFE